MSTENTASNPVPKPTDLPNPAAAAAEVEATTEDKATKGEKTLTQSQVDSIVAMEKDRAFKAAKKEAASELEEAKQLAAMSEKEAWEHKLTQAENKVNKATKQAQTIEVGYEIQLAALKAGVPSDQLDAITKLADLSGVRDDDGKLSAEAVSKAVEAVITKYPGLASAPATTAPAVGAGPSKTDSTPTTPANLFDAIDSYLTK